MYLTDYAVRKEIMIFDEDLDDENYVPYREDEKKSISVREAQMAKTRLEAAVDVLMNGLSYRQAAEKHKIALGTVHKSVNIALQKYEGFAGRTLEQWRTEMIFKIDHILEGAEKDMTMEASDDIEERYAGKIRNDARSTAAKLLPFKAKLLGLMVDRKEIYEEKKVLKVEISGEAAELFK